MTEPFFMYPPAAIDPIRAAIQKIKNHSGSALVVNAQTKRMDTARELLLNSDIEATDYRLVDILKNSADKCTYRV